MRIICKEIETIPELIDAIRLRVEVFIKEQGFAPGWEPDEDDKFSRQFVAVVQNKVVEFYEKCGFKAASSPYDAWGVRHIDMEYGKKQNG